MTIDVPAPMRVVYVVGSSHSGSTLLALLSDEHPQIASVGETAIKTRIRREGRAGRQPCSCGTALAQCDFWQRIFQRVSAEGIRLDAHDWSNEYRYANPWADRVLTRETSYVTLRQARRWLMRHVPPCRARTSRVDQVNVALVRAVLAETGAAVFLDATKLLTRLTYLLDIPELDVKIVRLTRDVRAIAASAKRRGHSSVGAARTWYRDQVSIERVLERLPHDRTQLVRYEDLCAQPRETLSRLWEFCGVDPFDAPTVVRSQDHHIIGNRMRTASSITIRLDESWKARLNRREQQRIMRVGGAMNEQFGYV